MRKLTQTIPWRPVPWALGLALFAAGLTRSPVERRDDSRDAVVAALARSGLVASRDGVVLIDAPTPLRATRMVVRAWRSGEPADIYLAWARLTQSGALVGTPDFHNLTSTPADEGEPVVRRTLVAFPVRAEGVTIGVRVVDLAGEAPLQGEWTRQARLQNALTNLQDFGQTRGIRSEFWAVEPPAHVQLAITVDGWLEVTAGSAVVRMPAEGGHAIGDAPATQYRPSAKAKPGNLVTWAVDRVRAFSWFGDDRMQMLKAVAFDAQDLFRRTETSVLGDATEEEIAADLGDIATRRLPTEYTDPETGWPPAPIKPFLSKPIEGEGQWIPLENDPFIKTNPGVPAAFLTSYVRTDRDRSYTRIYVTMWDPRQVQTHMIAGSVEPKGATGEAGPGLIPRTPERMTRLVAAINGGFQALHGEWGMMGDGIIYLPPKPFGATVAEMRDGWTAFGTWPRDATVPPNVLSYRQNLTPLVLDGEINPYKRSWWGGTPADWEDRAHSTRTGICLTQENFIAFFYGNEIDVTPLAQAMLQARCTYGLHLDMNPGHTGLEFYRVEPAGLLPDLGRALDKQWEAEGPVPDMGGWTFRARRMVRFMGLMNFPRYIQREARDYFYLTLRHVLPGQNLTPVIQPAEADEGVWRTKGLPQHGFPYAVATTHLRPDPARPDARVLLVKLDPRALRAAEGDAGGDVVVSWSHADVEPGRATLWMGQQAVSVSEQGVADGAPLVSGLARESPAASNALAAVGVQDADGMLVYAEVQQGRRQGQDGPMLDALLEKLGCSSRLLLERPLLPAFGQQPLPVDPKGQSFGRVVRLVRVPAPGAKRIFADTPIVDPSEWSPLQAKRIRYFRKTQEAPSASVQGPSASVQGPSADGGQASQ